MGYTMVCFCCAACLLWFTWGKKGQITDITVAYIVSVTNTKRLNGNNKKGSFTELRSNVPLCTAGDEE
jgi:hypothetical protein